MRRMSLVNRLLALTVVACLPGLAALVYSSIDLRNTRHNEIRDEALRNARFTVSEIDQIFRGIQSALHAVAEADEVRNGDTQKCGTYLARVRAGLPQITSILILDENGKSRCYSNGSVPDVNLNDRYYIREAMATRQFSVGNYVAGRATGLHILPVALPDVQGGTIDFVIAAGLDLEWLGSQLIDRGMTPGSVITVTDRNGIIVAREPKPAQFIGTSFPAEQMDLLSDMPGTTEIRDPDKVERIVGFVPSPVTPFGLFVSTGIAKQEALSATERSFSYSIMLFMLGCAAAFTLTWLVGNTIIRQPLIQMVATAESWRRGQDNARTGLSGRKDEIGMLGQTFDQLMEENIQRDHERELAESRREILVHELAHRVKNTLATVQSIASLSFRNSQGPEALRNFHDRLHALVRSHDLLTRRNWERADLLEVIEAALAPAREDRAHRFTLQGPAVGLPSASVVPIAMIFHELCTNSLKYGALSNDSGRVTVNWTMQDQDNGTAVSVTWSETEGPAVVAPEREGFGTRLIANLTRQLNGSAEMRYPASGFVCDLTFVTPHEVDHADQ